LEGLRGRAPYALVRIGSRLREQRHDLRRARIELRERAHAGHALERILRAQHRAGGIDLRLPLPEREGREQHAGDPPPPHGGILPDGGSASFGP
jgi:hypothetical protein